MSRLALRLAGLLALTAVSATVRPADAQAGTPAFSTTFQGNDAYAGSLGVDFFFTGSTPVWITGLGAFDDQGDGFQRTISVRLYDTNGALAPLDTWTLLAELLFEGTPSPLTGGFRFQALGTPIALAANRSYQIAASGYGDGERYYNSDRNGRVPFQESAPDGPFVFTGSRFNPDAGAGAPFGRGGLPPVFAYAAGNFVFTTQNPVSTVPEPATVGLLGAGLAVVGAAAARRRARATS